MKFRGLGAGGDAGVVGWELKGVVVMLRAEDWAVREGKAEGGAVEAGLA